MGIALAETYARDPNFYGAAQKAAIQCRKNFPVGINRGFHWEDWAKVGS